MSDVFTFYDPVHDRLFTSNVNFFPSCGAPSRARALINGHFHMPQFSNGSDPARPFFHTSRNLFRRGSVLGSLSFQHQCDVEVRAVDQQWQVACADHWTSLEAFLVVCSTILDGVIPITAEKQELDKNHWTRKVQHPVQAQALGTIGRKFLSYLVAVLSYRIFKYEEFNVQTWDELVLATPGFQDLVVTGEDGIMWTATQAVEELRHSSVTKYSTRQSALRVGVFIDPTSQEGNRFTNDYVTANVPVWFAWGRAKLERVSQSEAYGGKPPAAFIPVGDVVARARVVSSLPSRVKPLPVPPPAAVAHSFDDKYRSRVPNALNPVVPIYGEMWTIYLHRVQDLIRDRLPSVDDTKKQAIQSRRVQGWSITKRNRTVVYNLDQSGRIVDVTTFSESTMEIHRNHPPWERRYRPEFGQWDISSGFHRPPDFDQSYKRRVTTAYPLEEVEEDVDSDLDEAWDLGEDIGPSTREHGEWVLYKSLHETCIRPEDLAQTQAEDAPLSVFPSREGRAAASPSGVSVPSPNTRPVFPAGPASPRLAETTPSSEAVDNSPEHEHAQEEAVGSPTHSPTHSTRIPITVPGGAAITPMPASKSRILPQTPSRSSPPPSVDAPARTLHVLPPRPGFSAPPPAPGVGIQVHIASGKRKAGEATWAKDSKVKGNGQPDIALVTLGGRFGRHAPNQFAHTWDMNASQLARDRWCYQSSPHAPPRVSDNESKVLSMFQALATLGQRPNLDTTASVAQLADELAIPSVELNRLWSFVDDLRKHVVTQTPPVVKSQKPKKNRTNNAMQSQPQPPAPAQAVVPPFESFPLLAHPEHYLLAQTSWPVLRELLDKSSFCVDAVPAPTNARGISIKCRESAALCYIINEREASRLDAIGVIGLFDPLAVLTVFRSTATNLRDLAVDLAAQGIPFIMPQRLDQLVAADDHARYYQQQQLVGQCRPSGYCFTPGDYSSYLQIFYTSVQEDPRIRRLVMMMGGPQWRLALPYSDVDDVLSGPSAYAASSEPNLSIRLQYRGMTLVEDRLLDSEMQMLIGMARVPIGVLDKGPEARPSFLPPGRAWWSSIFGHVGWTQAANDWLYTMDKRYRTFAQGDASMVLCYQPVVSSRWPQSFGNHYASNKVLLPMRVDAVRFLSWFLSL